MKNNNSELKQAIKEAEEYLKEFMKDPRLTHKVGAGLCASLTRIGYDLLSKAGFPLRIAGGKAAFGINKGKWGIMDFGYSPYFPAPGTAYIGHFWLVADEPEWIIDFTLMFLKETMFTSDQERGLPRQPVNLRTVAGTGYNAFDGVHILMDFMDSAQETTVIIGINNKAK